MVGSLRTELIRRWQCTASTAIEARIDDARLADAAEELLGPFRVAGPVADPWRLSLGWAETDTLPPAEPPLSLVWTGEPTPGCTGRNFSAPRRRRLELLGRGWMEIDLGLREATIRLFCGEPARTAGYFLVPFLCECLQSGGAASLHAASLAVPGPNGWRSALLVAPSGVGKTTTALALADAGWPLLGDDLAFLRRESAGIAIWGFPRAVHVRRPTCKLLPWLEGISGRPIRDDGTQLIAREALGGRCWPGVPQPLPPAVVLCLERPNPTEHRFERWDRAAALMHLAHECVQPVEGHADPDARQAWGLLAELVQRAPAYRVSVGPRPTTLAAGLAAALAAAGV